MSTITRPMTGTITVEEYERLMALAPEAPPDIAPRSGTYRFTGVKDHRREYAAG